MTGLARGLRAPLGLRVAMMAGCLTACGSPAPRASADTQSLEDIGNRNVDAAAKGVIEQNARTRAAADIRAADRREAARTSSEQN